MMEVLLLTLLVALMTVVVARAANDRRVPVRIPARVSRQRVTRRR
jgi:hypothetical protein